MHNNTFLSHLHAFRGLAILTIVGAHAWSFLIFWTGELDDALKPVFWLTESLFHGSTLYFAIISGMLFQQVLRNRSWQQFYKGKVLNVLSPYIFMSLAYTGMYWQFQVEDAAQRGEEISFVFSFLKSLPSGSASIHFWYIPLLMFLFAITPILKFVHQKASWMLMVLALLPLVVSRSPFPDFLLPQSFVYFTGAYALGMLLGEKEQAVFEIVERHWRWLLLVVVSLTVLLYTQYATEFLAELWFSVRQTMVYMQKVAITVLVIWWLKTLAGQIPGWLMRLGDYAFAIFFLHVIFIGFFIGALSEFLQVERIGWVFLVLGALNLLTAVLMSLAVSFLVKKLFKRHARKIIGV